MKCIIVLIETLVRALLVLSLLIRFGFFICAFLIPSDPCHSQNTLCWLLKLIAIKFDQDYRDSEFFLYDINCLREYLVKKKINK